MRKASRVEWINPSYAWMSGEDIEKERDNLLDDKCYGGGHDNLRAIKDMMISMEKVEVFTCAKCGTRFKNDILEPNPEKKNGLIVIKEFHERHGAHLSIAARGENIIDRVIINTENDKYG